MATTELPGLRISVSLAAILAHLFGLIAIIPLSVWGMHFRGGLTLNGSNVYHIFNLHPFLMYAGYIFVSGEALMAFKTVVWGEGKLQKLVHMVFNLIGLAMAILGVYSVFKFHNKTDIANIYSLHSWIGLGTLCLFGAQWLFGFLIFWYPRAATGLRAKLIPWHALSGLIIFLLMICAAATGLVEAAAFEGLRHGAELHAINFSGVFILLYGAAVTFAVIFPS